MIYRAERAKDVCFEKTSNLENKGEKHRSTCIQAMFQLISYTILSKITAENCPEGSESEIHAEYITLVY